MSAKKATKLFPEARSNFAFNKDERESFEEYPDVDRPLKRGDCFNEATGDPITVRPCPFVTCKHNMFLYVHPSTGTAFADATVKDPTEMHPDFSCVLDIVDRNEHGLNASEIAQIMGFTRQAGADVLTSAMRNAYRAAKKLRIKKPDVSKDDV